MVLMRKFYPQCGDAVWRKRTPTRKNFQHLGFIEDLRMLGGRLFELDSELIRSFLLLSCTRVQNQKCGSKQGTDAVPMCFCAFVRGDRTLWQCVDFERSGSELRTEEDDAKRSSTKLLR
jgi:hypothetical protein